MRFDYEYEPINYEYESYDSRDYQEKDALWLLPFNESKAMMDN